MIEIPLSKRGKHAGKYKSLVSEEDKDLAQQNWQVQIPPNGLNFYVYGKSGTVWIHRVILSRVLGRDLLSSESVDHIDGNGLNNQRSNLRLATRSQNSANVGVKKHNKLGIKGVTQYLNKYKAQISVNGRAVYLGVYDTPEEAHEAYCIAAKMRFGEFFNSGKSEQEAA